MAQAMITNGSLANVVNSVASVGTSLKAFVLVHPISLSLVGGALVGYGIANYLAKKKNDENEEDDALNNHELVSL